MTSILIILALITVSYGTGIFGASRKCNFLQQTCKYPNGTVIRQKSKYSKELETTANNIKSDISRQSQELIKHVKKVEENIKMQSKTAKAAIVRRIKEESKLIRLEFGELKATSNTANDSQEESTMNEMKTNVKNISDRLGSMEKKVDTMQSGLEVLSQRLGHLTNLLSLGATIHPPLKATKSTLPMDCSEAALRGQGNGVHELFVPGVGSVKAKCVDGYTIFQSRKYGNYRFDRVLSEYALGFGSPHTDHWLGLNALYSLTGRRSCQLRVELIPDGNTPFSKQRFEKYNEDISGRPKHIQCGMFRVGPGDTFRLSLTSCTSDLKHPERLQHLLSADGMMFSTMDKDRDRLNGNCATHQSFPMGGGWWYNACGYLWPNSRRDSGRGQYCSTANPVCINWMPYILRSVEMGLKC